MTIFVRLRKWSCWAAVQTSCSKLFHALVTIDISKTNDKRQTTMATTCAAIVLNMNNYEGNVMLRHYH